MSIKHKKELLLIFSAALFFRLLWLLSITAFNAAQGFTLFDSHGYLELCFNILKEGEFGRLSDATFYKEHFRTPGYPLFLAPFLYFSNNLFWPLLVQQILGAISCCLVFLCAVRLGAYQKSALFAALFLALDIPSVLFGATIMSDGLFVFISLLSFYLMLLSRGENNFKVSLAAGILLGVAVLVRPIGILLPLLYLPFLIWKKQSASGIVFLLAASFIISAWMYRNQQVFGKAFLSTVSNVNLLQYRAAEIYAQKNSVSLKEAQHNLNKAIDIRAQQFAEAKEKEEVIKYVLPVMDSVSYGLINQNKMLFIQNTLKHAILASIKPARSYIDLAFGMVPGEMAKNASPSALTIVLVGLQVLLLILVWLLFAVGLLSMAKQKNYQILLPLLAIILYLLLASAGPEADARFRLPLLPFVLMVASFAKLPIVKKTSP
jgi:4-amino-4-deoxy-L-arabinose transferase-like glycosyltransferase